MDEEKFLFWRKSLDAYETEKLKTEWKAIRKREKACDVSTSESEMNATIYNSIDDILCLCWKMDGTFEMWIKRVQVKRDLFNSSRLLLCVFAEKNIINVWPLSLQTPL